MSTNTIFTWAALGVLWMSGFRAGHHQFAVAALEFAIFILIMYFVVADKED